MIDEPQGPTPHSENASVSTEAFPLQPKKSHRNTWIVAGVAVGILCMCSIICIAIGAVAGVGGTAIYNEKAPIEAVLDSYLRSMANKDADSAYILFSPRAQRQVPVSQIQDLLEGNNYAIFEGYQSLSVSSLNISAAANTNPDVAQGTVAKVSGSIKYGGGFQGSFNGTLEKVDGQWMIHVINVTVPPDKIK